MLDGTKGHVVELGFKIPPHVQRSGSKAQNSKYASDLSSMTNPSELSD